MIIFLPFAFLFGACMGSFLNVVILRIPEDQSIWRRSSHCMNCDTPIPPWWNIPVISYLLLCGKCKYCKIRLSPQYVIVEALTGLFFAASFYFRWQDVMPVIMNGNTPEWHVVAPALYSWLADCTLWSILLAMTVIDARYFIIPLELTISGFVIGLALTLLYPPLHGEETILRSLTQAGISIAVGGGLFYVVRILGGLALKREALGLGDVHLMIMFGVFLNWQQQLCIIFISACVGSIAGIFMKLLQRRTHWRFEIPYGPYLAAAALITYFWGDQLITWYMTLYASPM